MRKNLKDMKVEFEDPITILCDNTNEINISKNPMTHSRKNALESSIIY
jgi:hypothetical protein